ncbi:INO80 complex subunit B isoform X2 [Rhodnius prolixus]|uniref:INO80 complex subunit B isoform X2 n=1 Tax=Rhodnius prolixus TaxID=13249 RepID=UPI003D18A5DC
MNMERIKDESLWDIPVKEELIDNDNQGLKDDSADWTIPNEEEVTVTESQGSDCGIKEEIELGMNFVEVSETAGSKNKNQSSRTSTVTSCEKKSKRNTKRISLEDILPPPKKHKKHKHKKHKKKRSDSDGSQGEGAAAIKTSTNTSTASSGSEIKIQPTGVSPKSSSKKKKGKGGRDSGTSSDEERWLDAIESGKLEEVDDELKKIKTKDPKLMTARQRAMLERKGDAIPDPCAEQLLSLPTGYREKVMTPEMIKKAALKSQKRKQLQDEKREKDKKRTMERLLRKQDNKTTKQVVKKNIRKAGATITYCNNINGIRLSLPPGIEFPLKKQASFPLPEPIKCGVTGCCNIKKYLCSKTKIPLCSLECYKKNLATHNILFK